MTARVSMLGFGILLRSRPNFAAPVGAPARVSLRWLRLGRRSTEQQC